MNFSNITFKIAEKLKAELRDVEPTVKKVSARAVTEMIDSSKLGKIASKAEELQTVLTPEQEIYQLEQANLEVCLFLITNFGYF